MHGKCILMYIIKQFNLRKIHVQEKSIFLQKKNNISIFQVEYVN